MNETNFHMKSYTLGPALTQRQKATRKSTILLCVVLQSELRGGGKLDAIVIKLLGGQAWKVQQKSAFSYDAIDLWFPNEQQWMT